VRRTAAALLVAALALAGCARADEPATTGASDRSSRTTSPGTASAPTTPPATTDDAGRTREQRARRIRGVDVSHHQGEIDWEAVAGDGVRFAYLKATEGTTFTDPRYADNRAGALAAGLSVGGYHYFSLCTPGADQGAHFADALGDVSGRRHLPPVVDLELAGSCPTPPPPDALLAEVRAFIHVVEERTGREVAVYSFPDFEARYGFSREIDRRQWVRRLGDRPPRRDWWIWQRSQTGSVDGIAGPVDLDEMSAE
jgi:lysozyme